MAEVAIILADGFEEIEALGVFDILKRGDIDVKLVGLDKINIISTHGVEIVSHCLFDDFDFNACSIIVLPGGLPGANNLANSDKLIKILQDFSKANKYCAAICAAPMALAKANLIGSAYTCYPGFEANVSTQAPSNEKVVISKNIITSKGPATAFDFALVLLEILRNKELVNNVAKAMLINLDV